MSSATAEPGGVNIDAFGELQQFGHLDRRGLALLVELIGQELRRFPVLLGDRPGWTADDAWDWAHEFFAAKGSVVTAGLLAQTHDAASMSRYLRRAVRHFLVDQARKTPQGAVRRKIEELLAATPSFAQVPERTPGAGRWQLADAPRPPFGGNLQPLVRAAHGVAGVRAVRWSGARRSPLASDESLIAILRAIMEAADGSLEVGQLTAVLLQRFPAAVEYADTALDEQVFDAAAAPPLEQPDVIVEVRERALDAYGQLSPSQRALLPHLDEPISRQCAVLGLGRSQAYAASATLKLLLGEVVPDDELRAKVIGEVLRLCVVIS